MQQQRPTLEQHLGQQYARRMQDTGFYPRMAGGGHVYAGLNLTVHRGEDAEQRVPDWQVTDAYLANRGIRVKRPALLAS